ncbi:hypothetical protein N7460_012447 [Penicillium canescens]|uniref:Uncharacterized protein n=1 Tax=Penicillium canescens TaxID=5083 RepID=A0AAD6I3T3_PENCN|nr:hypothetical protein N7460_012447 [Penicillium canescens]
MEITPAHHADRSVVTPPSTSHLTMVKSDARADMEGKKKRMKISKRLSMQIVMRIGNLRKAIGYVDLSISPIVAFILFVLLADRASELPTRPVPDSREAVSHEADGIAAVIDSGSVGPAVVMASWLLHLRNSRIVPAGKTPGMAFVARILVVLSAPVRQCARTRVDVLVGPSMPAALSIPIILYLSAGRCIPGDGARSRGPNNAIIQHVVSLHGMLVLRQILGIGREVDDINLLKFWVVGVGKKLRDASCALGLSLLAAEDGQISWKGLHEVLLAAEVVLNISQFGQRINDPSLILSVLADPGTLVTGWGLTSLDLAVVDGE